MLLFCGSNGIKVAGRPGLSPSGMRSSLPFVLPIEGMREQQSHSLELLTELLVLSLICIDVSLFFFSAFLM